MGRFHIPKLFFVVLFLLETSRFCLCKNTTKRTSLKSYGVTTIYAGNLELCGAPLPERCPGDEPPQFPIPDRDEENDEEDKSEKVWFYTIPEIGLGYITGLWGVLGVLLFKKSWRYAYFQLANNVMDWIYVNVAIKAAWLKKKMVKNHAAN